MLAWMILLGYFLALSFIFVFSIGQLHLALVACLTKSRKALSPLAQHAENVPFVSVQLPIYNEPYVVERLLRQVAAMDYPAKRWEIQILDDSTDETSNQIRKLLPKLSTQVPMYHLRRKVRKGYKAGALSAAIHCAKGEIIAIFDADFLPPRDFLLRTVPYFENGARVGFVQTRWGHLNERANLLTRLQAFGLNGHFAIEQVARNAKGYFTNFNGTAGLWRKACLIDAGNWQSDTLTEDLDMSYRAQFRDWKYHYLYEVICPAELPTHIGDLKQQQKRWAKGAAETAKKQIPALLRAKISFSQKIHGLLHLLNSSVYPCILLCSLLSLPLLYIKEQSPYLEDLFWYASAFLLGFLGFCIFYAVMTYKMRPRAPVRYFVAHVFWFLAFSMGLSWTNSWAVLLGWLGIQSPFRRTPKQGSTRSKRYVTAVPLAECCIEGGLMLYFAAGIVYGLYIGDYGLLFFHGLLVMGYGSILWQEIRKS